MSTVERGWGAGEKILRRAMREGAGGVPPTPCASCRNLELVGTGHGRLDRIDERRGAVVNRGHAHTERFRIVQPAGDVVDGAARKIEPEPRADGVSDGL